MSVSILEALLNAEYNIHENDATGLAFGKRQLHNVIVLLEKGYGIYEKVEPLLDKYGSVEDVPEKEKIK